MIIQSKEDKLGNEETIEYIRDRIDWLENDIEALNLQMGTVNTVLGVRRDEIKILKEKLIKYERSNQSVERDREDIFLLIKTLMPQCVDGDVSYEVLYKEADKFTFSEGEVRYHVKVLHRMGRVESLKDNHIRIKD